MLKPEGYGCNKKKNVEGFTTEVTDEMGTLNLVNATVRKLGWQNHTVSIFDALLQL